ncbi:MAG TPA: TOBE domain-containing protein, partial [Gaiellales bacterium]|nr:TOBE domain-containing protein [Gaiellales bacterium]
PLPRSVVTALAQEGGRTATLGFRPEGIEFVGPGQGFPVEVLVVEELGSDAYAYGRPHGEAADGTPDRLLVLRADARKPPAKGELVHVAIRPGEAHVFSAQTGLRISHVGS